MVVVLKGPGLVLGPDQLVAELLVLQVELRLLPQRLLTVAELVQLELQTGLAIVNALLDQIAGILKYIGRSLWVTSAQQNRAFLT